MNSSNRSSHRFTNTSTSTNTDTNIQIIAHISFRKDAVTHNGNPPPWTERITSLPNHVHHYLQQLEQKTQQLRRLWLDSNCPTWLDIMSPNPMYSSSHNRHNDKDDTDTTMQEEQEDPPIEQDQSMMTMIPSMEQLNENEYFMDLTEASMMVWNSIMLVHREPDFAEMTSDNLQEDDTENTFHNDCLSQSQNMHNDGNQKDQYQKKKKTWKKSRSTCTSKKCPVSVQEDFFLRLYHTLLPMNTHSIHDPKKERVWIHKHQEENRRKTLFPSFYEPSKNKTTQTVPVAQEQDWWDRPLWAWTYEQILLACGIQIIHSVFLKFMTVKEKNDTIETFHFHANTNHIHMNMDDDKMRIKNDNQDHHTCDEKHHTLSEKAIDKSSYRDTLSSSFPPFHVSIASSKLLSRLPFLHFSSQDQLFPSSSSSIPQEGVSSLSFSSPYTYTWTLLDRSSDTDLIMGLLYPIPLQVVLYHRYTSTVKVDFLTTLLKEYLGIHVVSDILDVPSCMMQTILVRQIRESLHGNNSKTDQRLHDHFHVHDVPNIVTYLYLLAKGLCQDPIHDTLSQKCTSMPFLQRKSRNEVQRTNHLHSTTTHVTLHSDTPTCIVQEDHPTTSTPSVVTQSSPVSLPPRFDSNGIDLNVFEQLPAPLRSEVRISMLPTNTTRRGGLPKSRLKTWKQQSRRVHLDRTLDPTLDSFTSPTLVLTNRHRKIDRLHPHVDREPELDSHGIDLHVLSQLPPQLRSEVRLTSALVGQRTKMKSSTIAASTRKGERNLKHWLSQTSVHPSS